MSAEETESNLGTLMKVYYDRYKATSVSLGLREEDLLWQSFEDFERETSVLLFRDLNLRQLTGFKLTDTHVSSWSAFHVMGLCYTPH